jgi:ubiquinone/menaquinone biosynthesis C-methylase UbiE
VGIEVNSYFESRAPAYQKRSEAGVWRRLRTREYKTVAKALSPQPHQRLIDLGCGAGFYAVRLKKDFQLKVVAVDSSAAMLQYFAGHEINTVHSKIETLQTSEKFDLAVMAGVLEFVEHPEAVLKKCAELLSPGGRLVILIPPSGWLGRLYRTAHEFQGCSTYLRNERFYRRLAQNHGLIFESHRLATPISQVLSFTLSPSF